MAIIPKPVSDDVIKQAADLLNIPESIIKDKEPEFSVSPEKCGSCGKEIDFYDFVKTANDTGVHSRDFMVDFFKSDDSMEQELNNTIVCSNCGKPQSVDLAYRYGGPRICGGRG